MKYSLSFLVMLIFISCTDPQAYEITESDIMDYLSPLASDEFLGRKPFTEGETKTINFLKNAFTELGLEPGNEDSFYQKVPLVEIDCKPEQKMRISGNGHDLEMEFSEDYVVFSEHVVDEIIIDQAELVFCGYGIVAPEYNWNDYEGIDMDGKIAVVMVNDPGFGGDDPNFFKGNTMTYYGRWTYKYEEAARQGAEGVLVIHETNAAGYPWFVVQSSNTGAQLYLESQDKNMSRCPMQGWISISAFAELLRASTITATEILEKAKQPNFKPMEMGLYASTRMESTYKSDISNNVIAKITGSENPDEYIIYTAHWDHLGVSNPVENDSIYNGALDNASGTASMLAIAKAFSKMKTKPKRSIVFLAVTAEEQGLLGSAYYAEQPIYEPLKTIANLNMDSRNADGKMKDFTVTGFGQSELDDIAAVEAKKQGRYVLEDQAPEKGYFFRSDHFNFAKIGIPALYAKGRNDHWEKGKEFAKERDIEYRTKHYHRPSDEINDDWQTSGLIQDAEIYYQIGLHLANNDVYPKWKEGSEFKAIREGNN